jgi:hypothetical protein
VPPLMPLRTPITGEVVGKRRSTAENGELLA